jgi:hypothetical protein
MFGWVGRARFKEREMRGVKDDFLWNAQGVVGVPIIIATFLDVRDWISFVQFTTSIHG